MGRLTTHVLDTSLGKPAGGLAVDLWSLEQTPQCLSSILTNSDGRAEKPLLEGTSMKIGLYELRFMAGDYLRRSHNLSGTLFLDVIPIRFGIADVDQHYHVPLLLSPFGYSTYRGS